jgi:PAS domain S-box-containing protein
MLDDRRPDRLGSSLAIVGGLLALAIFLVDIRLPHGVSTSVLYVLVALLGLWIPSARYPVVAAAACSTLAVAGSFLSPPGGVEYLAWINRPMSLAVLWAAALLLVRHKRVEQAWRAESGRAQRYFDVATVILLVLDADGRVRRINRRGCDLLGWAEHEIVGRDWIEFVPERLREQISRVRRQAAGGQAAAEYHENPVLTRSGEERTIAWRNVPLTGEGGRFIGTLSSGEDITERRTSEAGLERSLKDLEDLKYALDQSSIVAITDTRGIIHYVNDKFCEISKYSRQELLGQDHRIINSGYHPKEFIRDLWATIANGQVWRGEIRNQAKDGTIYWVDTTIVPFLDARGKPYQYMAIRSEITERKRAEERLLEQASLARLGEMAAVVAHEVKNPLAGIRGALQVIERRLPEAAPERGIIGEIVARVDTLNEMVRDLLLFARPREPRHSSGALGPLLEQTAALLKRDPDLAAVDVQVSGEPVRIEADHELLGTVFLNLMINAAHAMGGRGRIEAAVSTGNGRCRIEVRDDGPGVPADVRERIFEPFFTTKSRGTGLGLATARRIVELHGGAMTVACPPEGGTIMGVELPLTAAPAGIAAAPSDTGARS